jgi:hypothetical protein
MTISVNNRLSAITSNTTNNEMELNQVRLELMMKLHEQKSTRNLMEEEDPPRTELRQEKARDQSPRSLFEARGDFNEATTQRLHNARDARSLKLPSLEERKAEDYLEMLNHRHADSIGPAQSE